MMEGMLVVVMGTTLKMPLNNSVYKSMMTFRWRVDDVSVSEDRIHYLLTGLKPHTQYALYVKTFTIATYRYGAKSDILYFKTLPDRKCLNNSSPY